MPIHTFSALPPDATLWMYLNHKPMSKDQQRVLSTCLEAFMNTWTAHQQPLTSAYQVDAYFLCLFVDEQQVSMSGCAMDTFIRALKVWEKELGLSFFEHHHVLCAHAEKDALYTLDEVCKAFERGQIGLQTLFYDHTLKTKADYLHKHCRPLADSWLFNYVSARVPT